MQAVIATPAIPTGAFKSFGPFGPKYQVGQAHRQIASGEWMVEIVLIETGEVAEYRLTDLLNDPDAE